MAVNAADPNLRLNQGLAHRKIGDVLLVLHAAGATDEYEKSLDIISALANGASPTPRLRGELASAQQTLGRDMLKNNKRGEAEPLLRSALGIREELVAKFPNNEVFISNLASSYTGIANLYENTGNWNEAINEYETAIDKQVQLSNMDSSSFLLKSYLTRTYKGAEGLFGRYIKTLQEGSPDWLRASAKEADLYSQERSICQILAAHGVRSKVVQSGGAAE